MVEYSDCPVYMCWLDIVERLETLTRMASDSSSGHGCFLSDIYYHYIRLFNTIVVLCVGNGHGIVPAQTVFSSWLRFVVDGDETSVIRRNHGLAATAK
jgi:hypothetical protein